MPLKKLLLLYLSIRFANREEQIDTGKEHDFIFISPLSAGFTGFYGFSLLRGDSYDNTAG
jgi:hypothetical protein